MPQYFFSSTDSALSQITKLFDFVWPTAAGMWNLRWQVDGFLQAVPHATEAQLKSRFTEGSGITGANFRRVCVEHTWEQQKEFFGRFVLTNAFAIYEGWIEETLTSLGKNTKALQLALQFPDAAAKSGQGATNTITDINAVESTTLKDVFYPTLTKGRHYSLPKLDAHLYCYRFFKELRNCDMHRNGIADQRLLDAHAQFQPYASVGALGVTEVPAHTVPTLNAEIKVSLRGAVGFTGIIHKLVATIDAELSKSQLAEKPFVKKWKLTNTQVRMLSANRGKRANQVIRRAILSGFPVPADPHKLGDWLAAEGLSHF